MNMKIKMLLLFCVGLTVYSCSCEDCGECGGGDNDCRDNYYVNQPHYINKSGMLVKIYGRWFSGSRSIFRYSYEYVQNGDTLPFTFIIRFDDADLMEIQFLENSTNCLVYSGPIQDSLTDMRSLKAYEKGDTIPGVYADEYFVRYFYTITQEHRAMAKKEYCQAPYW